MPSHSPETIVKIVDKMEMERSSLHKRMDGDIDRYHLKPYGGEIGENGEDDLAGYKHFTSNDPRTNMDLALHMGSTSKRIIRVHEAREQKEQRENNNNKELFCLGVLAAADERRGNLNQPDLQDALFSQSLFRGRIAQRALLVKEEREPTQEEVQFLQAIGLSLEDVPPFTRTYEDIADWDPRNTYWGMGKHGLAWACEKSYKSRNTIKEEYDVDPIDKDQNAPSGDDDEKQYAVYDWLDDTKNTVVLETHEVLKKPIDHGMGTVPVAIFFADSRPEFQGGNGAGYDEFYGDGFYKANRGIFDEQNFMFSVISELSKRSIKNPVAVMSKDGTLTLPEDPWVSGQETSLSTDQEQALVPLPHMEMAQTASVFLGVISSMGQRGSFPSSTFGNLDFQLSGFAISQLRTGVESPLTPHVKAVTRAMTRILNILADAYASGQFDTMSLSGRLQNPERTYFSEQISSEMVRVGGTIEVKIVPNLPQDDAAKVTLIQMLRDATSGAPVIDDRLARDMLDLQDPQQIERAVWEQMAQRGSPVAIAWNSYLAMAEQGDEDGMAIWWEEFQLLSFTKRLQMAQLMMLGGGGPSSGPNGNGSGSAPPSRTTPGPSVLPPQAQGINARPNLQSGPNVPAGTPRPGAQNIETRLANAGLFGPSG